MNVSSLVTVLVPALSVNMVSLAGVPEAGFTPGAYH